ncbi:MAG: CPBP family intramembrane metalloprotease [Erysipelotrichaceae bacterium]|nr:CPBP family intramembrane metalloprotease [Erysipelotrichaceae bacterium]
MDEKRQYLKAYRCFGGCVLFIGFFSSVLAAMATPATILFSNLFGKWGSEIFILVSGASLLYSYYVGYRIFVKMHRIELIPFGRVRRKDIFPAIISCILSIAAIRLIWHFFMDVLMLVPQDYDAAAEIGIISALYTGIIAPLAEEILFRGWLMKLLRKYGPTAAIFFTAVSFGLFHGNIYQSVPALFIGVILGYLAIRYDSLLPSFTVHAASNIITLIDRNGAENELMGLFGAMTLVGIMLALWHNRHRLFQPLEDSGVVLSLMVKSLSFIVFVVMYLFIIRVSMAGLAP